MMFVGLDEPFPGVLSHALVDERISFKSGGHTGTASTSCFACASLKSLLGAIIVRPVAKPIIAMRMSLILKSILVPGTGDGRFSV